MSLQDLRMYRLRSANIFFWAFRMPWFCTNTGNWICHVEVLCWDKTFFLLKFALFLSILNFLSKKITSNGIKQTNLPDLRYIFLILSETSHNILDAAYPSTKKLKTPWVFLGCLFASITMVMSWLKHQTWPICTKRSFPFPVLFLRTLGWKRWKKTPPKWQKTCE